jgi:glutaredoxin-like protein
MLDEKNKSNLRQILQSLTNKVNIVYFTQEFECDSCYVTRTLIEEVTSLSDKLSLTVFDFVKDAEKAKYYNVDKIPSIVLLDEKNNDKGIKFYGIPAGYEINSFIKSLIEVSGNNEALPFDLVRRIKEINTNIHIQVFVTPTCPYCPQAVAIAHKLALENSHIKADMVDATIFPHLSNRYNVQGVPKIVINEKYELLGAQPIEAFLDTMEKIK